jgi:hypothetical protein
MRGPLLRKLLSLLEAGKRLRVEESWPEWYRDLIARCCGEAEDRPSFADIVERMEREAASVCA